MGFWNTIGKITGAITGAGPLLELGSSVIGAISGSNAQKSANQTNLAIADRNNQTAIDIANKNNQAAIDLQRENNEFNRQQAIDMFNMEANYNSPENQVARLRSAGINPSAFFGANGQISTGNESAAAPQAAAAGVSFQQPNLTTPQVSPIPSIAGGVIGAMEQLARIQNIKSNTGKTQAETQEITTLLGDKLRDLIATADGKELQNAYQEFENIMQPLYADNRLRREAMEIANLVADYNNALATNQNIKADTAKKKIETKLAKTNNKLLKQQSPLIISNLQKQGKLIDAQVRTEGTKQAANMANAKYYTELGITENQMREYKKEGARLANELAGYEAQENGALVSQRIETYLKKLKNEGLISDEEYKQAQQQTKYDIERSKDAAYNNTWFMRSLNVIERINNGITQWIPFAPDHGDYYESVEHFDSNGNSKGGTTTTRQTSRSRR